jgi:cell division septation protein DedD
MAQQKMVTFRLHRTAVIFMVIGALLLGVAIFVGGYLLGRSAGVSPAGPLPTLRRNAAAPAGGTPALQTAAPAPKSEELAIRVATFGTEEEAKAFVQQLAVRKLSATIVPVDTSAGVKLYTVQVGHYATRAAAAAAAKALHDEHGLQAAVVPAGMGSLKER